MVTINDVKPQQDSDLVKIEYTINFDNTNHNTFGNFMATNSEYFQALKNISESDNFLGVKRLVLQRMLNESTNLLKEKFGE